VPTDPTFALSMAVLTAAAMILVLHLVDVNEKEPAWAVGLMLALGAVTGWASASLAEGEFRRDLLGAPASAEAATLLAITLGVIVFQALRVTRKWSELNGVIDGVIYGAAAGLGVALGSILVDEIDGTALAVRLADQPGAYELVWESMRETLYQGLFGAIIGAGIGAAAEAARPHRRAALAAAGPVIALVVQYCSEWIRNDTSFASGSVRQGVALLLPVGVVTAIVLLGLSREREALVELQAEVKGGVVTDEDLEALASPRVLRRDYLRSFGNGDLERWEALRSLHNRQLQLALAKRRTGETTEEIVALRKSIRALRARLEPPQTESDRAV
jgi:RsiW-degrading membrane proteinase PrsW (M82 family)